jgi:ribonuclease BN (tRNA processing enzyme)
MDSADLSDGSGAGQPGPTATAAGLPHDRPSVGLSFTVLGSAGTFPGPHRACSGYLIRTGGTTLVVDLGSGALANLQRHVDLREIDAVVLSHEHPDHWLDVPLLRNALRYVLGVGDVRVYGTAGTRRLADQIIGEMNPTLVWTDIDDGGDITVGDVRLRFSRTDHPVDTLAVRIDGGERSLLYTADTGVGWHPGPLGDDVDLLLCEASLPVELEDTFQHLSGRQAGALAAGIGARRLVVTHVVPDVDPDQQVRDAATRFSGPIEPALDGHTITV